jgi:hypothetical protein
MSIGVAVADNPLGPFRDALGAAQAAVLLPAAAQLAANLTANLTDSL